MLSGFTFTLFYIIFFVKSKNQLLRMLGTIMISSASESFGKHSIKTSVQGKCTIQKTIQIQVYI